MNKTLALYVEEEYLIAGVEPLRGKFEQISKRGISHFPFYFFIDKINHKIDYSFEYKKDYETGNLDYVGDFLKQIKDKSRTYKWYDYDNDLINLLLEILDDIKKAYFYILNSMSGDENVKETEPIPVHICFSDNVDADAQKIFKDFLSKHNFIIRNDEFTFSELIINQYLHKENIESVDKDYAILESIGEDLHMSVVKVYTGYDRERTHFKTFNDFGVDPRLQVIAKKIVDDLNRQEGLLNTGEQLKKEYKNHRRLARDLVKEIESTNRPYLRVQTNFQIDENKKLSTTLSIEEIEQLTSFHVRQISRFFVEHFAKANKQNVEDFDKIFLIGNALSNELVKKEFSRFGNEKLVFLTENEITWVLMGMLLKPKEKNMASQAKKTTTESKEVPFVTVGNLEVGKIVKLSNNNTDKRNGRLGPSEQVLEYLGGNTFKVLHSTRSLNKGDIATSIEPNWVAGMQINLSIKRNGQKLGIFKTRPIVRIEIQ